MLSARASVFSVNTKLFTSAVSSTHVHAAVNAPATSSPTPYHSHRPISIPTSGPADHAARISPNANRHEV